MGYGDEDEEGEDEEAALLGREKGAGPGDFTGTSVGLPQL